MRPLSRRLILSTLATLLLIAELSAVITVVEVTPLASTTNAATYANGTAFAPTSEQVSVCIVGSTDSDAIAAPTLAWTTGAEAWTAVTDGSVAAADTFSRLTWFYFVGAHASSQVTATFAGNQTSGHIRCWVVTDPDVDTPVLQVKGAEQIDSLLPTVTMDDARTTGSVLLAMVFAETNTATDCVVTEEAGYTLGTLTDISTPNVQTNTQYQIGGGDHTPLFTLSVCGANTDSLVSAIEIARGSEDEEPPPATGAQQRGLLLMGVGEWR